MQHFKPLILIAFASALAFGAPAIAAVNSLEDSVELELDQVENWPLGDAAKIIVRACDTCEQVILSVTTNTCYLLTGPGQKLEPCTAEHRGKAARERLLRQKTKVRDPGNALVYIFYRATDRAVTRLVLDTVINGTEAKD
jgi:hypothetical protein